MTNGEIIRLLKRSGFVLYKHGSKHTMWKCGDTVVLTHGTGGTPMGPRMQNDILLKIKKLTDRAERRIAAARKATIGEIRIGREVLARIDFVNVPKATRGIIVEDYGSGVWVAWQNDQKAAFDKALEICFLEPAQ